MFSIFKRKPEPPRAMPQPGETWSRRAPPDGSPFPPRKLGPGAKVIQVQNGWVRFDLPFPFFDQRMPVEDFVKRYER